MAHSSDAQEGQKGPCSRSAEGVPCGPARFWAPPPKARSPCRQKPPNQSLLSRLVEGGGFTGTLTGPLAFQGLSPPYCGLCSHWAHGSGRVCPAESRLTWEKLCLRLTFRGPRTVPAEGTLAGFPPLPTAQPRPTPWPSAAVPSWPEVWEAGGPTLPWAMNSFLPHRRAAAGSPSVGTGVAPKLRPGPVAHTCPMTSPLLGVRQPSPPSSLTRSPALAGGTPSPFLAASPAPGPGPSPPPGSVRVLLPPHLLPSGPRSRAPSWAPRRLQPLAFWGQAALFIQLLPHPHAS